MTDKTRMSNLESYQELTIQISTLNLKLDKILSLLNKPEQEITIKPFEMLYEECNGFPLSDNENFEESYK